MVAFCIVQSTDGTGELGFNSTLVKYSETNPTIYSVENIHLNSGLHLWFHIRHLALRVKLLLTGKKKKRIMPRQQNLFGGRTCPTHCNFTQNTPTVIWKRSNT
uniref:Uncharacterized protein n=1 Tax=Anguilla anguilla TaxID=7936 RepID=A0A0E9X060_ANGAN